MLRPKQAKQWLKSMGDDLGLRISYTIDAIAHQEKIFHQAGDQISRSASEFLGNTRASDTIFILGSGNSIRYLREEDYAEFSKHDTLAFNFWIHNKFIPNFYMLQRPKNDADAETLWCLARQRRDEYSNCKILLRGDSWKDSREVEKFLRIGFGERPALFLREWPVYSKARINRRKLANFLHTAGYLSFGQIGHFTPKFGSTLLLSVVLGFQMGYKNIVLVGIDNNKGAYFYTGAKDKHDSIFTRKVSRSQSSWLDFVNNYLKEISETRIWIYDENSALSSKLPRWKR